MGSFVNPTNTAFSKCFNSEIYVDKSELIAFTNKKINSLQQYICSTRPRRFGKTMAVDMLAAYYSKGCDSRELFEKLKISSDSDFEKHLNKYDVIKFDMQNFCNNAGSPDEVLNYLQSVLLEELDREFPECNVQECPKVSIALREINRITGKQFIILIDEWDAIFRLYPQSTELQTQYIDFLRSLFKGMEPDEFVALAYITGILPVKKYNTESALNNFIEYTMLLPGPMAEFVAFTENEVADLCSQYDVDFGLMQKWYNGYYFKRVGHVYNPNSIINCIQMGEFSNYWTQTSAYESLKFYIDINMDGLKDDIIAMLAGVKVHVDTLSFQNDMVSFANKNDILTLLIHLGYLAYEFDTKEVFIPNLEIRTVFETTVRNSHWDGVATALAQSQKLMDATLRKDADTVAKLIRSVHIQNTSLLAYNDENSLSCVIAIAYYCAQNEYVLKREVPLGEGFADVVFIPKKDVDKPALVVELKYDKSADKALDQIYEKQYADELADYTGKALLVGINYNSKTKEHSCVIEEIVK